MYSLILYIFKFYFNFYHFNYSKCIGIFIPYEIALLRVCLFHISPTASRLTNSVGDI